MMQFFKLKIDSLIALLLALCLVGCKPADEGGKKAPKEEPTANKVPKVQPKPQPESEPEPPAPEPELAPEPTPQPVPGPKPQPAPKPEVPVPALKIEPGAEDSYVEEYGEPRPIPKGFKEYPEWGVFVYSDQLLRMYQDRLDKAEGDQQVIDGLKTQMTEAAANKEAAYGAMAQRHKNN